jgi:hypothetical protein
MKGRPIDQIVYEQMFPKPKSGDPQSFHDLLRRHLVPEVRSETACFYGGLDSREAQYPGLDYSHLPHRVRLSRFPWHRRLFRAFDALGLTRSEISGLTKWEGTRWAKERFEKEEGIKIRDTTGDCIQDWVDPELRQSARVIRQPQEVQVEEMVDIANNDDLDDEEESDMEIDSVGVELNERLRAAAAQREAGNATTVMDAEWEQWLKDAAEAGVLPSLSEQDFLPQSQSASRQAPTTVMPPHLLNAARLGQWHEVPDSLHGFVRRSLNAQSQRIAPIPSIQPSIPARRDSLRPLASQASHRGSSPTSPVTTQQQHAASSTTPRRSSTLSRVYLPPTSTILPSSSWQSRAQQQPQS